MLLFGRGLAVVATLFAATMAAAADTVVVSGGTIVTDANGGTAEALIAKLNG